MKKIITIVFVFACLSVYSQNKRVFGLRVYAGPNSGKSVTVKTNTASGETEVHKKRDIFGGLGIEGVFQIGSDWSFGTNLSFAKKGEFSQEITAPSGSNFSSVELSFIEYKLFLERLVNIKSKSDLLLAAGFFSGVNLPMISDPGFVKRNDYGITLSFGVQQKRLFFAVVTEQGLRQLSKLDNVDFKTSIWALNLGVRIL